MALSTGGWQPGDRLAPIPAGLVPVHLRPRVLGEAGASGKARKRAGKPPAPPAASAPPPAARPGRPPRRSQRRYGYAELPPAPGVVLPGLPAWPRQAVSETVGLTLSCRDKLCRRKRRCRHDATECWIACRRQFEETLARMSDTRRAGLYRRAAALVRKLADIRRMAEEMCAERAAEAAG